MKICGALCLMAVLLAAQSASAFVERESCRLPIARESLTLGVIRNYSSESSSNGNISMNKFANLAIASVVSLSMLAAPFPVHADGQTEKFKLPPIDYSDKNRCKLSSSTIGQANAARDKLYDLRQCQLSGASAPGFDLSGVIMTKTDLSKANFQDAYFSKGYLQDSNFEGADFTNAIVDRATFKGSSLRNAIFKNTVLTGTNFDGADLEGADFTEAALGSFDLKSLCKNPTLKGENPVTGADTRFSVGCGGS
ncbi:pentapeptide repeat protein [Nitzschia inconspicua]|uniref:Pentapeptide repeat protein n=1 Tax=Nitzschia inconspicua TaxID=303405 RepID=A0A9K3PST0_9STRA|nr:pentapeptide repeat protein [Nitzschia inconspicua]